MLAAMASDFDIAEAEWGVVIKEALWAGELPGTMLGEHACLGADQQRGTP
jgi:hypothetical protein